MSENTKLTLKFTKILLHTKVKKCSFITAIILGIVLIVDLFSRLIIGSGDIEALKGGIFIYFLSSVYILMFSYTAYIGQDSYLFPCNFKVRRNAYILGTHALLIFNILLYTVGYFLEALDAIILSKITNGYAVNVFNTDYFFKGLLVYVLVQILIIGLTNVLFSIITRMDGKQLIVLIAALALVGFIFRNAIYTTVIKEFLPKIYSLSILKYTIISLIIWVAGLLISTLISFTYKKNYTKAPVSHVIMLFLVVYGLFMTMASVNLTRSELSIDSDNVKITKENSFSFTYTLPDNAKDMKIEDLYENEIMYLEEAEIYRNTKNKKGFSECSDLYSQATSTTTEVISRTKAKEMGITIPDNLNDNEVYIIHAFKNSDSTEKYLIKSYQDASENGGFEYKKVDHSYCIDEVKPVYYNNFAGRVPYRLQEDIIQIRKICIVNDEIADKLDEYWEEDS
ncbi:MAG: hypothetical protein K6D02_00015 [Lachnospiraceae bacterium]|nr:hypothetical protein [Lachnospiraceae bacterium]